jgi:16S rRNA processing protein RimM
VEVQRVVVAEIFKPRGVRGELIARSQTDIPGRLETLKQAQAHLATGQDVPVELEEAWEHRGDCVLKFVGVDSTDAADVFRGADLWVPPSQRGELPEGGYFQSDLTGCLVVDRVSGKNLGVVSGWQEFGGPLLMRVLVEGREVLVPFAKPLCQVDLPARQILVDLPAGLLDL